MVEELEVRRKCLEEEEEEERSLENTDLSIAGAMIVCLLSVRRYDLLSSE